MKGVGALVRKCQSFVLKYILRPFVIPLSKALKFSPFKLELSSYKRLNYLISFLLKNSTSTDVHSSVQSQEPADKHVETHKVSIMLRFMIVFVII